MKIKIEKIAVIVGGVFTVVGVIVIAGFFLIERQDRNKRLEAVVISETRLLNPNVAKAHKNLRLLYNDKEVYDLSIMQIKISNSGSQPIRSEDIEEPITIVLEGISEIVWSEIISTEPPELIVGTSNKGDCVELSRALLNPEDQLIVEVVSVPVEKSEPKVLTIKGRIAGIKRIQLEYSLRRVDEKRGRISSWIAVAVTGIGMGISIIFIVFLSYFTKMVIKANRSELMTKR